MEINSVVQKILSGRNRIPAQRGLLVAISGIDGSGKGYLAAKLAAALCGRNLQVANVNVDGWLNLPHTRFARANPAQHFYLNAIRFDEMFAELILPLRDRRSLIIEMDYAAETATEYRKQLYEYQNVDIILLEGIYLLKRAYQHFYDLTIWIDCSYETALERALARSQEGLPRDETIRAYQAIYFPAQQIHFQRDDPKKAADLIVVNDPRLEKPTAGGQA
ncbi:MAG TPA: uridine kinase [Candidatus Binatia bacterium]|nr:uridine kinase [Candidatus Binatia bacterium]